MREEWIPGAFLHFFFKCLLAKELLEAVHFPACSSGASTAPQTFTLTPASYSHSTSTSLHSIGFRTLSIQENLFKVLHGHIKAPKVTLERAASHLKVIYSPCLFWLPPWENVYRSANLVYST